MAEADNRTTSRLLADADLRDNIDDVFLIGNGIVVVLMQAGFTCLEAGSVRSKNVTNIVLKNVLDMFISGVLYWLVGFALAFGSGSGPLGSFFGGSLWAGGGVGDPGQPRMSKWFFQFTFAATAATIISGAVAERCRFVTYLCYSATISGLVYPTVSHWAWHPDGWLNTLGFRDFAGSGVVHLLGGACALAGCVFLGPRRGRFVGGEVQDLAGHSTPLTGVGALILAAGFLGFNGGSQGSITAAGDGVAVSTAVVNTVLSGAGGALCGLFAVRVGALSSPAWGFAVPTNAMLAGMVSVCGSVNSLAMWAAVVTGAVGAVFFLVLHSLLLRLQVDDPLDAAPVHLGAGLWGLFAGPLLSPDGILHSVTKESLMYLACNAAGALAILVWSLCCSAIMFTILRVSGLLRVSEDEEIKGLDVSVHKEPGYPVSAWVDSGLPGLPIPNPAPHKFNRPDRPPGTPLHRFTERL
ncbi:putative ammonium transporter 1 [Frankliniella occidentalis]|uniref:Ammonium transporter n=1 Tax=Frankliniella occidentalis TaxID=133901 RepID=A0A6J1SP79_FRAOC|nr:putative ammonium transporter 1 [Frankliniella occidentalis]